MPVVFVWLTRKTYNVIQKWHGRPVVVAAAENDIAVVLYYLKGGFAETFIPAFLGDLGTCSILNFQISDMPYRTFREQL